MDFLSPPKNSIWSYYYLAQANCWFIISSTDPPQSDVIYSFTFIYTHTVYCDRLCDATHASIYNVYKVCNNDKKNFFSFSFHDWCLCVFVRTPGVEVFRNYACGSLIGTWRGGVYTHYIPDTMQSHRFDTDSQYWHTFYVKRVCGVDLICIEKEGAMMFVKLSDIPCLYVL